MNKALAIDSGRRTGTLTSQVFYRLYDDILSCRLAPGTKLHQKELRAEFGTAGSAVREALAQLASLGLVTTEPQRGFRVAQTSIDDLIDLTKTRIWIESIALRSAIANGGREWEASIVAALHMVSGEQPPSASNDDGAVISLKNNVSEWRINHQQFHDALVASCGLSSLMTYRSSLTVKSDRYRKLSSLSQADRNVALEHNDIANAVLKRDANKAVKLIEDHFLETASRVLTGISSFVGNVSDTMTKLREDLRTGESQ